MLYFAYGSNMNRNQMKMRCPDAIAVGVATLKNHKLIFRGVADIVPEGNAVDAEVKGVVWKITKKCLKALDRYEGFPTLYGRKNYKITIPENGQQITAIAYYMHSGPIAAPSRYYWQSIMRGYFDFRIKPGQDMITPNKNVGFAEAESYDHEGYYGREIGFSSSKI